MEVIENGTLKSNVLLLPFTCDKIRIIYTEHLTLSIRPKKPLA